MKKYLLLLMLIGVTLYACKKDRNNKPEVQKGITGYWDQRSINEVTQNLRFTQYQFGTGDTFRLSTSIHDKNTFAPLGYVSIVTGKYEVTGNQLKFYNQESYSKADYQKEYVSQAQLVKQNTTPDASYTFNIDANKVVLSLAYNCPANALCSDVVQQYNRSATD